MKNIVVLIGLLALAGCASTQLDKMTSLGPNAHQLSVHAISLRNREVNAFMRGQAAASARCAEDRMVAQVIKTEAGIAAGLPEDTVVLTFRCVAEQDPAVHKSMPLDSDRA